MKIKLSKWAVIKERDEQIRIFHSIFGNIMKIDSNTAKILEFLKTPRALEEISNKFDVGSNNLKNAIKIFEDNRIVIGEETNENIDNNEYFKECFEFEDMVLRFYVTERCNFGCEYCFERKEKKLYGKNLNLKTAETAIDGFVEYCKSVKKLPKMLKVYFFGGEPLMNWVIVPEIFEMVKKKVYPMFEQHSPGITTNTVLMTDEVAKYLYDNKFLIYLSLDGVGESNDICRKYMDGRGIFNDFNKNLNNLIKICDKKFIENNIGITSTITPGNIENVPKLLEYVKSKGLKNISINRVSVCGGINKEIYDKLHIPNEVFFKHAKKWYEMAEDMGINVGGMWGSIRDRLMRGTLIFCNAIGREFGVGPNGIVYPCPFVFGSKDNHLAEIINNKLVIDVNVKKNWCGRFASVIEECKNCEIIGICAGGCLGAALYKDGSIYKPTDCELAKMFADYFIWRLPR